MANMENLTGRRFGQLIAEEHVPGLSGNYASWRCRCTCGREIIVDSERLKRGTVWNCGCVAKANKQYGSRAEALVNRQFGRLTVLRRAENKNGRVAWLCECQCGNKIVVTAHDLKEGKVKSCGCLLREKGRGVRDLQGQDFGQLHVLYSTNQRDEKGSVYWHCRCRCGRETDVTSDSLLYGGRKSCGCLKEEVKQQIHSRLHCVDGTIVEMLGRKKARCDNRTGVCGVHSRPNGTYRASIGFKRKKFHLGTYYTLAQALAAREEAEETIHGSFLRIYAIWKEKASQDPAWAEDNPLEFDVEIIAGKIQISSNMMSLMP